MQIEHIAIWTKDLERLREFYETYFDAKAGEKYVNLQKGFESYFLSFTSGARLEFMCKPDLSDDHAGMVQTGYAHMAFAVGSKAAVVRLTEQLAAAGVQIIGAPRYTGDGYFESVVADPDGNLVEITI